VQKPVPTFLSIISTDYLAQNFFIMSFGVWMIYLVDALFEGHTTTFLLILAILITPVGIVLFRKRYELITSSFSRGMEVRGKILEIQTISEGKSKRDYILDYDYEFEGVIYEYRNHIKKNDFARTLRRGQTINLMVNDRNPNVAFIKEVYLIPETNNQ